MSAMLKQKLIDIANGFTKYGLWKGGSKTLSELNDVTLTNLQKNDVLTYNGSEWVNDDNLQNQIDTLNSNLESIYNQINSLQTLNPGNKYNFVLDPDCAYLIFICKYDTSTTSKYDGTNLSIYVATTTTVRTFAYPIVNKSAVTMSLTNLLLSLDIPSDGYVRKLYFVKFK